MLTRTDRHRIAVAALISATVIGLAISGTHHHPHTASPAVNTDATVTITYPTSTPIPEATALAIGQARTITAAGCPSHRATAWAEVDETGRVLGIHAACMAGPYVP